MNNNDIKYSSPATTTLPIQFGDFTEQELMMIQSHHGKTTTTTKNYKMAPLSTFTPHTSLTSSCKTNTWFIFGSFTEKECMEIQNFKTGSLTSTFTTNISSPPRRRCFRCGYNSHTIENCVATRHRSGEYIGYPSFPPSSPSQRFHYISYPPSPCISSSEPLKYLRQGDFIFDISELREWMVHDYEYRLDTYLESLQVSVNVSSEQQFQDQCQKIEECLYLNYLTTDLLFERQASNYFHNLYKKQVNAV